MKEKLKKFDFKHLFIVLLITLLIGACVLVICLLNKYDENRSKTILTKYDDDINLNLNYHLDNNGNIVSDNLLDPSYILLQYTTSTSGLPITPSANNRAVTNYLPISSNTTYTVSCSNNLFIREVNYASSVGVGLGANVVNASQYTFTTPSNAKYLILLFGIGNQPDSYIITLDDIVPNCMLNLGSSALSYEPYGIWYSNVNTIDDNQNSLSNYKSAKFYYNNSNIYSTINLRLSYDVNYGFTFLDLFDGEDFENLDYIDLLYEPITINNSLLYVLTNGVGRACHIVFYNDNSSVLDFNYPYVPNDTNTSDDMPFPIEISGTYTFNKVRVYNLRPNGDYGINFNSLYLNSSNASYNYLLGFQDGYNRGIEDGSSSSNDFLNLQTEYNSLSANYQTLLDQYNVLLNQSDYSFSELFWSISAVPFGVLTSAFNVNVLGVNLRGIITGLFTALLLIWLIRRLF